MIIRLPGCRPMRSSDAAVLVLLVAIVANAVLAGDWGTVWATVMFCGGLLTFSLVITALLRARNRRPGESFGVWYRRAVNSTTTEDEYHYVRLACGHRGQIRAPVYPAPDTVVWCPGHRRFGPALRTTVIVRPLTNRPGPTIGGVELD